jgi:hypothetical protein
MLDAFRSNGSRNNKNFVGSCERELEHSRQIYNAALAERLSRLEATLSRTSVWRLNSTRLRRTSSRRHVSQEWIEARGAVLHRPATPTPHAVVGSKHLSFNSEARLPHRHVTVTTPLG